MLENITKLLNEDEEIDFKKFRPLMLAMAIEIFYLRELQTNSN